MPSLLSCVSKRSKDPPNTVYLSLGARVKTLDPIYADDSYTNPSSAKIYETLYQYHYLKRPLQLEGLLAEGVPRWGKDRKTLTIKIKKGVLFQDDPCFKATGGRGREMTASDIVYSFKRLADPKLRSTGWWIFDHRIKGLNEWRKTVLSSGKADYSQEVAGLKATGRHTLRIELTQPSVQFLFFLTMPFTSVVAKEAVQMYGEDFRRTPVGTGPYLYDRKNSNLSSKLIFNRNPTYRHEVYPTKGAPGDQSKGLLIDAGKPLPRNDKIVVEIFQESQPMWLKFMSGDLDLSGIPKDNFATAIEADGNLNQKMKEGGIQLVTGYEPDLTFVGMNLVDSLLGENVDLRRALSRAYDSDPVIKIFYNGRATRAVGPIPPGLTGYDPKFKNPYREFSVKEAKKLLAKAGFPAGKGLKRIEYLTNVSTAGRQMSELLKKQMAEIGVDLKLNLTTWPEFQKSINNKKAQLFGMSWRGDYPDAENFLQLFYSKNAPPHGSNYFNYKNHRFDALYEKSLTLKPGSVREKLYRKMNKMIARDVPAIFGAHRIRYVLVRAWLKNYKMINFSHNHMKYYRIDSAIKNQKN